MKRFHWPEKLFYRMLLKERKYRLLVVGLVLALAVSQFLLTIPAFRKIFVLTERYEGEPVKYLEER